MCNWVHILLITFCEFVFSADTVKSQREELLEVLEETGISAWGGGPSGDCGGLGVMVATDRWLTTVFFQGVRAEAWNNAGQSVLIYYEC